MEWILGISGLANLLRDCLGLGEEREVIGTSCLGIRSAHVESAEGRRSNQGSCAFSGDVKITHMKLVLGPSCFSTHQQASFLFPDFDITLNRHSVPSPNMLNPGPTGLFTALPDFCQSGKREKRTGQRPTKEPEVRMEGHCFGFGTSNFGFPVRG